MKKDEQFRIYIAIILFFIVIPAIVSVYAYEAYLGLARSQPYDPVSRQREAAAEAGRAFDDRTKLELLDHVRQQGTPLIPYVSPGILMYRPDAYESSMFRALDEGVFPLGGVANRQTVYCRERGDWIIYATDEHGFRNPPGLWDLTSTPAVLVVGDSYGAGACVSDDEMIVAPIRAAFPRTINLSTAGATAEIYMAAIREYGPVIKPRVTVILFYGGNDTPNEKFQFHPYLSRYLDPEYTQGLYHRQSEIDAALLKFLEIEEGKQRALGDDNRIYDRPFRFIDVVLLRNTRTTLGWVVFDSPGPGYDALEEMFITMHRDIAGWGGKGLLVYLPSYNELNTKRLDRRDQVLALARDAGFGVLDATKLIEEIRLKYAFYFPESHYRAAVYRAIGAEIIAQIATTRGVIGSD